MSFPMLGAPRYTSRMYPCRSSSARVDVCVSPLASSTPNAFQNEATFSRVPVANSQVAPIRFLYSERTAAESTSGSVVTSASVTVGGTRFASWRKRAVYSGHVSWHVVWNAAMTTSLPAVVEELKARFA